MGEIKALRKDLLASRPINKPIKPPSISTGFKETPSGILMPSVERAGAGAAGAAGAGAAEWRLWVLVLANLAALMAVVVSLA